MSKDKLSLMEFGKMMKEVIRIFKVRFDEQIPESKNITTEQFGLLHAIKVKEEEVIQKDMAEMMGKDKSAILRLIDSLEEKELVRRVVDSKDRRKNYLMVTKTGERIIEQYKKIVFKVMEELEEGLTPSEIETFHKVVDHVTNKAKNL